jgi:hypothetical protein
MVRRRVGFRAYRAKPFGGRVTQGGARGLALPWAAEWLRLWPGGRSFMALSYARLVEQVLLQIIHQRHDAGLVGPILIVDSGTNYLEIGCGCRSLPR